MAVEEHKSRGRRINRLLMPLALDTHPGPVLVAVASGMLSSVGPGQGFVEGGGHVHLARNEGTAPVRIVATFLARTGTTEFLRPASGPGPCRLAW